MAAITATHLPLERQAGGFELFDLARRAITPVVFPRRLGPYATVDLCLDATRIAVVDHGALTLYDAATMRELRREPAGGGWLDYDGAGEPVTWPGRGAPVATSSSTARRARPSSSTRWRIRLAVSR